MHLKFVLKCLFLVLFLKLNFINYAKAQNLTSSPDSSISKSVQKKHFNKNHSPKKALILSFALPGAGQIYNRKFWKLPIVYGGLGALTYLAIDNGTKYQCYRKSYFAMVDDDPLTVNTCDPNQSAADMKLYRDNYQKNYEYSIAGLVGFYLLVAADAFVDAHLKNFDISDDLTLKIKPDLELPSFGSLNSNTNLSAGISFEFNLKQSKKTINRTYF
jgi:hypothetical protein